MVQRKLPAFQFYPADYMKDPGIRILSHHDRGVWVDCLCLMHESEQRGLLMINGKAMTDAELARALGLPLHDPNPLIFAGLSEYLLKQIPTTDLTNTLTRLLDVGVASRHEETGALMSRRMVRDEALRQIRTECGRLGGNPNLVGGLDNQNSTNRDKQKRTNRDKQKPTPSSSSSSSDQNTAGASAPAAGQLSLIEDGAFEEEPAVDPSVAKALKEAKANMRAALEERIGTIPNPQAQNVAIQWLLEKANYTVEQCIECLDWQLTNWSKGTPSWLTVKTHIGAWILQQKNGAPSGVKKSPASFNKGGTGRVVL